MSKSHSLIDIEAPESGNRKIQLGTKDIHVWYARLDRSMETYWQFLSGEENERAERYRYIEDKHRFIARHGILRMIISYYSGIEPDKIRYVINGNGKPALANIYDGPELFFNQTHSGNLAAYAITELGEIGIDIELIKDIPDITDIARTYFSRAEYLILESLYGDSRIQGFYHCWTRKEALIKALGEGLSNRLSKFEVSLSPYETPQIISIHDPAKVAIDWTMRNLNLPTGFVGALVVKGKSANITHNQWLY